MTTRRDFMRSAAVLGAANLFGRWPLSFAPSAAPMRLLVLGGTGFIGPHLVRHAVSRGHHVTIFTRGRRQADLPNEVERLLGDRNGQLGALQGKRWDAVFDDSATDPEWVRQSAMLLKDTVGQYLFTSSTGVYYPYLKRGLTESDPVSTELSDPNDGSASYGVRKAQCERLTLDTFGDRGIVVRPTYIVGPGDTTDRFPYWPQRLARGGETLAPGKKDDPVQIIDVRDLVEFMLKVVEEKKGGVYNVAGPQSGLTISQFLDGAIGALESSAKLTWVDDYAFLEAHRIRAAVPWIMLRDNNYGHTSIKNDRAVATGLTFRPLATTVRDTLAWWNTVPAERRANPRFAITPEIEAKALADWHALGK
ncbi:MAG TPA: NAD-dependent epimerase/dehydratase family protein [Gemmatimonadaceae bacterium]|nr:NAD-dependent epimerase/dehydratase family protein [Gemmatimonadaceae bacterium]